MSEDKAAELVALEKHRPQGPKCGPLSRKKRSSFAHVLECGCGAVIEVSALEASARIGSGACS